MDHAHAVWGWSLALSELGDVDYTDTGIMHRSFPYWVEERIRQWAAPPREVDDDFHPYGD